jgi:hypothetical protein
MSKFEKRFDNYETENTSREDKSNIKKTIRRICKYSSEGKISDNPNQWNLYDDYYFNADIEYLANFFRRKEVFLKVDSDLRILHKMYKDVMMEIRLSDK